MWTATGFVQNNQGGPTNRVFPPRKGPSHTLPGGSTRPPTRVVTVCDVRDVCARFETRAHSDVRLFAAPTRTTEHSRAHTCPFTCCLGYPRASDGEPWGADQCALIASASFAPAYQPAACAPDPSSAAAPSAQNDRQHLVRSLLRQPRFQCCLSLRPLHCEQNPHCSSTFPFGQAPP